jgi:hypothetical protein
MRKEKPTKKRKKETHHTHRSSSTHNSHQCAPMRGYEPKRTQDPGAILRQDMASRRGCPSLRILELFGIRIRTKFDILSVFGKQILSSSYKILRIHPSTDTRSHSNALPLRIKSARAL